MKLHLTKKLAVALITTITAVGITLSQTQAGETPLTLTVPANGQITSGNSSLDWTGSTSAGLSSWKLTFELDPGTWTDQSIFNLNAHTSVAYTGYHLYLQDTSTLILRDDSNYNLATGSLCGQTPITLSFVQDVDEYGDSLGTGTFYLSSNGGTVQKAAVRQTSTSGMYNTTFHPGTGSNDGDTRFWTNSGNQRINNITLTQLDDNRVTTPTSTWLGTEDTHNWADRVWSTGTYQDGSVAVFDENAEYNHMTISEATTAAIVSVSGQEYTFEIEDGCSLTAAEVNIENGASLTIVGEGTASIIELSGAGNLTVGEGGNVTVNGLSSDIGTLGVAGGGTLNLGSNVTLSSLTVENGTVTTQHASGSGVVANTLTIRAGGTFKVVGRHDAFGYGGSATKNIVMGGKEDAHATLALEQTTGNSVTMSTNIAMHGYSDITVKDGGKGFSTYGGDITVDGVENTIAVIDLRTSVTIDVAAEGELSVGKFTRYDTLRTEAVTKTGEGNLTIAEASTLPGMLNINGGTVSIEADTTLAGLSLNASGTLELTTGANMHIGSIVSMGADQSADAMISGALEVANDNMHGVGGKGLLKNTCMETSDNYTIEDMSISGSLIDVGEGTTLYLVNVDIKSDTHITDEAAWLDMKATKGWLDKDNTQVVREYTTEQDTTLFKSGDTQRSITLAVGSEIVELTSDMFDTVTMTGTDLWLDMTGIAEATYNKDFFTLDFQDFAREMAKAQVDVENLRVYATLDGERYTEAYSTANGGLTTTLYFQVPEPATGTMSLLALAALAARRRRK